MSTCYRRMRLRKGRHQCGKTYWPSWRGERLETDILNMWLSYYYSIVRSSKWLERVFLLVDNWGIIGDRMPFRIEKNQPFGVP